MTSHLDPIQRASGAIDPDRTVDAPRECGPFTGLAPHARGGLGEVFRATDQELHRTVAIKRLHPRHSGNADSSRRFLLEAELTARLEHPGVVPVYRLFSDTDNQPAYAMRFVDGHTLATAIAAYHAGPRDSMTFRRLLQAFLQVCQTVAYAHNRGVIHRDLKPQNIMVGMFGEILVLDWGLAKVVGRAEDTCDDGAVETLIPSSGDSEPGETAMGSAVGTPAYMSPEQAAGRWDVVAQPTDVYGLGAVLYTVLTGQPPLEKGNWPEMQQKIQRGDFPRPRQLQPDVPRPLEAVCLKAMALDPPARYSSVTDLAADVEHWLADEPVAAYREPAVTRLGRWARRHKPLVSGAAVLLLSAVFALTVTTVLIGRQQRALVAQKAQAERNLALAKLAVDKFLNQVTEDPRLKQSDLNDLRKELLESALPYYEEFVQHEADDAKLEAERGRALYRLAHVRAILGEHELARTAYEQMAQTFIPLVHSHPDEGDFRRDLARSHAGKGQALMALGRREESEREYRQALDLGKRLAADFPNTPDYDQGLGASYHNLGLLLRVPRPHDSEQELRQAVQIRQRLATNYPQVPVYRHEEAATRIELLYTLGFQNRTEEAAQEAHRGLVLLEQLAVEFPRTPDYRLEQALARLGLGKIYQQTLQVREGVKETQQAAALLESLSTNFRSVVEYRVRLGEIYVHLGNMQKDAGALAAAQESNQSARKIFEELADSHDSVPRYRDWLAMARAGAAVALALQGNYPRAVADVSQIDERMATTPMGRYNVACFWSVACSAVGRDQRLAPAERQRLADDYAGRALTWLRHARAVGYFRGQGNIDWLNKDPDLAPLRGRLDFQEFLAKLEKPER